MDGLHIVWDWNGTLLDDLGVVIESLNRGIAQYGLDPIVEEQYRDHFTRPVRAFYDSLFARPVSDMEWEALNKTFHDEYFRRVPGANLTVDSLQAIDKVETMKWSQSVLSMSPHDELLEIVSSRGIESRFSSIAGLESATGGLKAADLDEHLSKSHLDPAHVVVIGDTPDDAVAARQVGSRVVLYDGGSHHLPTLEAMNAPVAHSLVEAVEISDRLLRGEHLGRQT